ncbi:MAG: DUF3348 domain-containing protein [Lysobacter sp.]
MLEVSRRATVRGPTFIRLLARLTAADVSQSPQSLSDRLSEWIDWTQAVALSTALERKPSAAPSEHRPASGAEDKACAQVRAALTHAIDGDPAFSASGSQTTAQSGDAQAADYAFFRQRYLVLQQSMDAAIGRLRERLRDALIANAPGMARIAAMDAVMERALSRRERTLWTAAPVLLGQHFERLRQVAQQAAADADACGDAPRVGGDAWLEGFRNDMRSVLLAELDVRLQPAEGLLEALRTSAQR